LKENGHLFIVAGPSGSGKSTLIKRFLSRHEGFRFPTSVTTRPPREGEVEGDDYFFVSVEEFKKRINGDEFLEWAKVYERYYGTLKSTIEEALASGQKLLKDIDIQGAEALMEVLPREKLTSIFISPPSFNELKKRLLERETESPETLGNRLAEAEVEMAGMDLFDEVIVNDVFDEAYGEFEEILLGRR
jgi:guanylate kinase